MFPKQQLSNILYMCIKPYNIPNQTINDVSGITFLYINVHHLGFSGKLNVTYDKAFN